MFRRLLPLCCLLAACIAPSAPARAGSGLLGLDHVVPLDDKGIWARRNQLLLLDAVLVGEAGVALNEGGDTRLGHTMWQSIDATVVGGIASKC